MSTLGELNSSLQDPNQIKFDALKLVDCQDELFTNKDI